MENRSDYIERRCFFLPSMSGRIDWLAMVGLEKLCCVEDTLGTVDVYERFMVGTPTKNSDRQFGGILDLVRRVRAEHFDRPFGYIGNRENRTVGDPSVFALARKLEPLWASFALVSYSITTSNFFHLESLALGDLPNALFHDLEEAMRWTDSVIREVRGEPAKL